MENKNENEKVIEFNKLYNLYYRILSESDIYDTEFSRNILKRYIENYDKNYIKEDASDLASLHYINGSLPLELQILINQALLEIG